MSFKYGLTPSNTPSKVSGGTAHILPLERKKATFDVEKLTNFIDGGAEWTKKRRWIISQTEGDDFKLKQDAPREEHIRRHIKSFIDVHLDFAKKGYVPNRKEVAFMSSNSTHKGALMNSYGLFLPTLLANASTEQLMTWMPKVYTFQITGCYAQTELGHGSNVRGLETTATYDKTTKTFVLDSPTLTSIKWWPGALGKVATHAVVYAQLIIDNRQFGLHVFMVQLRDEHHMPLPGIELGDLGPKMGDAANDTGFCVFSKVRIPREHMLAKNAIVTEDGRYFKTAAKKENPMAHYATMLGARAGMMAAAGGILAAGATIITRYSLIRVQGFVHTDASDFKAQEMQIIDYQTQRYRIAKQIAIAYAMTLTGSWLSDKTAALTGGGDVHELTAALPEIHASAAGLKALSTLLMIEGLESLRQCAGGNGYLLNSGIAQLTNDLAWQITAEGEATVMLLVLAKFLIKSLEAARRGEKLAGLVSALQPLKDPGFKIESAAPPRATSVNDFKDPRFLERLFQYRSVAAIVSCGDELDSNRKRGLGQDATWNASALNLVNSATSHAFYFMLCQMNDQVEVALRKDANMGAALRRLAALYGCSQILDGKQWLGVLHASEVKLLNAAISQLLEELRPDMLALVEAYEIPDRVLNSTIGRRDGAVYEALFEAARDTTLNKSEVFSSYEEVLKPHLDGEFLQNKNLTPLVSMELDEEGAEEIKGELYGGNSRL